MARFSQLDDYLIHQVFSCLGRRTSLVQVALVCRRFRVLAQEHIARSLDFSKLTSPELLWRTIDESPIFSMKIRQMSICGPLPGAKRFLNLRSLTIDMSNSTEATSGDIVLLMFVGQLSSLSLQNAFIAHYSEAPIKQNPRTSTVQDLELNGREGSIDEIILVELLRWPKALKRLSCHLPRPKHHSQQATHKQSRLGILSRGAIQGVLEMHAHTLETLQLKRGDAAWWSERDSSQLNLRKFQSLKNASFPTLCIFDATVNIDALNKARDTIERLLPPSLQT
jgi:hypothetical protein